MFRTLTYELFRGGYSAYTWKRALKPTPVFFPGDPHGQKSLAGYSPWGCKELDTTEQLSTAHSACNIEDAD